MRCISYSSQSSEFAEARIFGAEVACDKSEFRGTLKAFPTEGGLHLNSRKQSLDALRGIAVLMVVASHYSVVLPHRSFLLETGWVGVDLFFVLSGFLISGLLFSEVKAS